MIRSQEVSCSAFGVGRMDPGHKMNMYSLGLMGRNVGDQVCVEVSCYLLTVK